MTRDTLFLLRPGFEDPAYPGQRFYCWHCALLEGVLASFGKAAGGASLASLTAAPERPFGPEQVSFRPRKAATGLQSPS